VRSSRATCAREFAVTSFERVLAKQQPSRHGARRASVFAEFLQLLDRCSTNERRGFSPDSTIRDIF